MRFVSLKKVLALDYLYRNKKTSRKIFFFSTVIDLELFDNNCFIILVSFNWIHNSFQSCIYTQQDTFVWMLK